MRGEKVTAPVLAAVNSDANTPSKAETGTCGFHVA